MADAEIAQMPQAISGPARLKIFISYSRKDAVFTRGLADALATRGYEPDFDQASYDPDNIETGIAAEDEWWQRLQQMIAAASTMVFIVSPDSASSKVCDEEIAWARGLGKRIIPILRRSVDFAKAPPRLSSLNIKLDFTTDDEPSFTASLDDLCKVLDRNVAWHRENTRFTALAARWEMAGRPEGLLLSDTDLLALGQLLEERPRDTPEPFSTILEFRNLSRDRLHAERNRQRRIIGRAFVKPAQQALEDGHSEQALRLAAAGALLANDTGFDPVVDTQLLGPLTRAIHNNRTLAVLSGHTGASSVAAFSPDGQRILTVAADSVRIWDTVTGRQIATLEGHTGSVESASFSPDGQRIVTASADCSVRLWDTVTGRQIAALEGHTGSVESASFSPDGQRIVTASADCTVRIWEARTGKLIGALTGHTTPVVTASFSPDGRHIVSAAHEDARIWNAATQRQIAELRADRGAADHLIKLQVASFSPDGQFILTASSEADSDPDNFGGVVPTVRIWDAITGKCIATPYDGAVSKASFSPDGEKIIVASGKAQIWAVATGEQITEFAGHTGVVDASFSPDGERIVTASSDTTARIWDAVMGKQIAVLKGHIGSINSASFSPDGRRIVTASCDNTTRIWDAATSPQIAEFGNEPYSSVSSASFSPDGQLIVTASDHHETCILDAATGKRISRWRDPSYSFPSEEHWQRLRIDQLGLVIDPRETHNAWFSPDGRRIVSVSYYTGARVWDAATGRVMAVLGGDKSWELSACFSPDCQRIVTVSSDNYARIWEAMTGEQLAALRHTDFVSSGSFSPDGERIVTACFDGSARLWDATGKPIATLTGNSTGLHIASFSPDGQRIVTASSDGNVCVWEVTTSRQIAILEGHTWDVNASFSPDGQRIVTASIDDKPCIWDAATGQQIAALEGPTGHVRDISFSPDGRRIVAASSDGRVLIWDATTGIQIVALTADSFMGASFSPDGQSVLTVSVNNGARLWDVSRSHAIARTPALVLAAALSHGIGRCSDFDRRDLLLQTAPEDMYAEALRQLDRSDDDREIAAMAAALAKPLHPNCYLSPTQLVKRFGPAIDGIVGAPTDAGTVKEAEPALTTTYLIR